MAVDEADYCETQVAKDYSTKDVEDDEDDDPDDSKQVHKLKVCNSPFLTCCFDGDTKMAHLGPT